MSVPGADAEATAAGATPPAATTQQRQPNYFWVSPLPVFQATQGPSSSALSFLDQHGRQDAIVV